MSKDPTCIQPYLQNFNFFFLYECPQCHSRYSVNMGIQLELRFSQLQKRAVFNFQSFQEKRLSLWCFTQCLPCNFNPWNHPFMTFPSNIRGWQPTEEGVLCVRKVHGFLKMFRSVIWFNLLPSSCKWLFRCGPCWYFVRLSNYFTPCTNWTPFFFPFENQVISILQFDQIRANSRTLALVSL